MILMRGNPFRCLLIAIFMLCGCVTTPKHVSRTMEMAERGDVQAQYQLGLNYTNGTGVAQDYSKGAQWFLKAALQGKADAQFMTGVAYAAGRGVPRDPAIAYEWFDKAANQGHPAALYQKADALANGRGVGKNVTASVKSYEKAARLGHVESKYALGVLLLTGRTGKADKITGNAWILSAADDGYKDAQTLFDTTCKKLSKKQLKKVKTLAKQF